MKENKQVENLLNELIAMQQKKLLACGQKLVPRLTEEDILQPNDYPLLDNNPLFRYEEGVLIGIKSVQSALFALLKDPVT